MNTKAPVLHAKSLICVAVLAAYATLAAPVQAGDRHVTVTIPVNTSDLNLSQPTWAKKLYVRILYAANRACTNGDRVGLEPVVSFHSCYEQAIGDAVRSANRPQLTLVYLASHTVQDAASRGIEVPVRMATK